VIYGGSGYWINPGPGNKNYWFTGAVLERKITDHFMLGIELFYQTANVVSTASTGFGGQTMLPQPSHNIGTEPSTGFNIGGIYDFTEPYHFLFSFGRGLQNAKKTNEFSWYLGFEFSGGE